MYVFSHLVGPRLVSFEDDGKNQSSFCEEWKRDEWGGMYLKETEGFFFFFWFLVLFRFPPDLGPLPARRRPFSAFLLFSVTDSRKLLPLSPGTAPMMTHSPPIGLS